MQPLKNQNDKKRRRSRRPSTLEPPAPLAGVRGARAGTSDGVDLADRSRRPNAGAEKVAPASASWFFIVVFALPFVALVLLGWLMAR